MKHPLEQHRREKFIGLPEFAAVCERVMSELDFEQVRGTVTNVPDERTIRYYMTEGLIQTPVERLGSASVFGYLNLLQLVAVKKLQAEHLPIRKIRELVAGKNEQELESLLGIGGQSGKRGSASEAKRYLESLLTPSMSQSVRRPNAPPTHARQKTMSSVVPNAAAAAAPEQTDSWQRLEIEPGLELHIRSDYAPPSSSARTRSVTDKIRAVISRYWREK